MWRAERISSRLSRGFAGRSCVRTLRDGACTRRSRPFNATGRSRWSPLCPLRDHLHTVWTLPRGDARYPVRWKRIKQEFTRRYLKAGGEEVPPSRSRVRHAEPGIWQRRYWEHTIEDEDDLKRCVERCALGPQEAPVRSERPRLALVLVSSVCDDGRVHAGPGTGRPGAGVR